MSVWVSGCYLTRTRRYVGGWGVAGRREYTTFGRSTISLLDVGIYTRCVLAGMTVHVVLCRLYSHDIGQSALIGKPINL